MAMYRLIATYWDEEFDQACEDSRHDLIDSILEGGYIPSGSSIVIPCENGDLDLVCKLLKFQMDFQDGFITAVSNGHLHLLDHLYTNIDINYRDANGNTILHSTSNTEIVKWILDMGCVQVPNNKGSTPLHEACRRGKLLLKYGGQQVPNAHGDTPMHIASRWGYTNVVKVLLQYGGIQTATGDSETLAPIM